MLKNIQDHLGVGILTAVGVILICYITYRLIWFMFGNQRVQDLKFYWDRMRYPQSRCEEALLYFYDGFHIAQHYNNNKFPKGCADVKVYHTAACESLRCYIEWFKTELNYNKLLSSDERLQLGTRSSLHSKKLITLESSLVILEKANLDKSISWKEYDKLISSV